MPPVKRPVPAKAVAKPGAKKYEPIKGVIYEDDERPQARLQYNLNQWYNKGKARREGPQERTFAPQRTKDDALPPVPPSLERGLGDWYRTKAPPLFIQPSVGVAGDAKQAAGMRYGFTDEAKDALRATPTRYVPQTPTDNNGGHYEPDTGIIQIRAQAGREAQYNGILAHEFGHKWWFENLPKEQQDAYVAKNRRWGGGNEPNSWLARESEGQFNADQATTGLYDNDDWSRPTETHARAVAKLPELNARPNQTMPPYMQPYFRGLVESVPNPRPWPNPRGSYGRAAPPTALELAGPDAAGNYGAPPQRR